jgi:hypothetical protein
MAVDERGQQHQLRPEALTQAQPVSRGRQVAAEGPRKGVRQEIAAQVTAVQIRVAYFRLDAGKGRQIPLRKSGNEIALLVVVGSIPLILVVILAQTECNWPLQEREQQFVADGLIDFRRQR